MKSAVTESNFKGMSDDQFTREFGKPSIRIGSITLIIGFVLAFVPAFTLWLVYGVVPTPAEIAIIFTLVVSSGFAWMVVEPISYYGVLGAAGSYLMQAEGLSLLGGDALPLGILENVESGEKLMQLHQGDTLILLSDGVEDAYENRQAMEETIRDALTLETAQDAANAILTGAQSGDTAPADDQTVLVLRLIRARADAKIEEMYQ